MRLGPRPLGWLLIASLAAWAIAIVVVTCVVREARAEDAARVCRVPQGIEPMSTQKCYVPGSMGSDALREREREG